MSKKNRYKGGLISHPDTSNVVPVKFVYNELPSHEVAYHCGELNIGSYLSDEGYHVCLHCKTAFSNNRSLVAQENRRLDRARVTVKCDPDPNALLEEKDDVSLREQLALVSDKSEATRVKVDFIHAAF